MTLEMFELEFNGVSCPGCIKAIENKLSANKECHIKFIDNNTGRSIIDTELSKTALNNLFYRFQGCCTSCLISIESINTVSLKDSQNFVIDVDEYQLIKKQYRNALKRILTKEEVACSDFCVCKTTTINRFEEFANAPSFSSIYNLTDYLLKNKYLKPEMTITDFGSGTGHDTFQIAPLIYPGQINGIDITSEMVDYATKTAHELHLQNVSFHQNFDLSNIEPDSQDLIFTNNVFNLLKNKSKFLLQVFKCLKSNGIFVIADEFSVDFLPESLRKDPMFQCGGIPEAQPQKYVENLCAEYKLEIDQKIIVKEYSILYNEFNYLLQSVILIFKKNV